MALYSASVAADEVSETTELLPLEHSTSTVWKFIGFPSKDGKMLRATKRNSGEFNASFVDATIRMLVTCGST